MTSFNVPAIKEPIRPSPGFAKKELADFKLDLMGKCGFRCKYCSSNIGNYLRIRRARHTDLAEQQLRARPTREEMLNLTIEWPDIIHNLVRQLGRHPPTWGEGKTLVVSMLTDPLSPELLESGVAEQALRLVLNGTRFRIRMLTKNAIAGSHRWIELFQQHPDRFVVGLSIGTTDNEWARRVEVGTSEPRARVRAVHSLQDGGVPTYGMQCPVFPDALDGNRLEDLLDQMRPDQMEHMWIEPYNDRQNWKSVRAGYDPGTREFAWMTDVFGQHRWELWSTYAAELYLRARRHAERNGSLSKLRYLLYEDQITADVAPRFGDLQGVLLQSKKGDDGLSRNPAIAALQRQRRDHDGTADLQTFLD